MSLDSSINQSHVNEYYHGNARTCGCAWKNLIRNVSKYLNSCSYITMNTLHWHCSRCVLQSLCLFIYTFLYYASKWSEPTNKPNKKKKFFIQFIEMNMKLLYFSFFFDSKWQRKDFHTFVVLPLRRKQSQIMWFFFLFFLWIICEKEIELLNGSNDIGGVCVVLSKEPDCDGANVNRVVVQCT